MCLSGKWCTSEVLFIGGFMFNSMGLLIFENLLCNLSDVPVCEAYLSARILFLAHPTEGYFSISNLSADARTQNLKRKIKL